MTEQSTAELMKEIDDMLENGGAHGLERAVPMQQEVLRRLVEQINPTPQN